ncbi:MAG: 30S ribosomal protein S20 [Actinomycetota bacterium]|nr:30S ribosomal protein S20 [Dehalococcoidia bacterium]MEC7908811.1 30S ribosomal protein S20 [Actinomycetota bacterium]
MANIKSAIKRNRQNEVRRLRNRSFRSEMRTLVKSARETGTAEDTAAAIKKIDRAAAKGIIHTNKASREKSRLQKSLNSNNS